MVKYCGMVEKELAAYFEHVLNVEDVREVIINAVGERRTPMLGEFEEREI